MNKTDIITKVSEKSGVAADVCAKVVKAFEEQSEDALISKLKGIKNNRADIAAGISEKTGFALEYCEEALAALEETVDSRLADRLKIFRQCQ